MKSPTEVIISLTTQSIVFWRGEPSPLSALAKLYVMNL